MNCKEATKVYEGWLGKRTRVIEGDLQVKHQQMSADIFSFMRATFYRWLELWTETCADLAKAPVVLAVGDLHVENLAPGVIRKGVWFGASMIEMKPLRCHIRMTWYGWR